jgi:hypothetical protein
MSTCCNRMFHAFQMYVTYISSRCCKSRFGVVYVVMAIRVCCKCMFQLFQTDVVSFSSGCCLCCSGYTYVVSVFSKCFRCFIWMLYVFHLDIAYVAVAIYVHCKCMFQMFTYFRCTLQVFYLDVAYVAVVIHICCKRMFQFISPGFSMLQQWCRTKNN